MTCTFANTHVPPARTIRLVNTADAINVGERPIVLAPGEVLTFLIDATKAAGEELCSVSGVTVVDVGTPTGELTVDNSDVQGGGVLLLINAEDADDGDEWTVSFAMHPDPEQIINASVSVQVEAA